MTSRRVSGRSDDTKYSTVVFLRFQFFTKHIPGVRGGCGVQREYLLGGVAAALVVASLGAVLVAPGVIADPAEDPAPPGDLTLRETPITPANVTGDSVTLTVTNWLAHRGGPMENVTLLVRTVDGDTGLITDRARESIGTVDSRGDVPVRTNVTVERAGGYDIETLVFANGTRVEYGTSSVSGVSALEPDVAQSSLQFHHFEGTSLPTIAYHIDTAGDGEVTMDTRTYLTNGGSTPAGDLQVIFRARQADSNIVADRAVVPVSDVRPGRTATPSAALTVPDNYTYKLDAVLLRDDVIVDTASAVGDLNPTREVDNDTSTETVNVDAESFAQETEAQREEGPRTDRPTASGDGPGFGPVVALAGLLAGLAILARRTR